MTEELLPLWQDYYPRTFHSNCVAEPTCSGKWLVTFALGDPDGVWEKLKTIVNERTYTEKSGHGILGDVYAPTYVPMIPAMKRSTEHLDKKLGYHLVCLYCSNSEQNTVKEVLMMLRKARIFGKFKYKSDLATYENRQDNLYTSDDFE